MAAERTARVTGIHDHGHDTRSIVLALDEPLRFRAGQFISCLVPAGGERLIRPYSIASPPDDAGEIEILYNLVAGGPGSHYLHGLRTGDVVRFTGPWGTFTLDGPLETKPVFIAENTGIAPIRSLIVHHSRPNPQYAFELLYGTVDRVYFDELAGLVGVRAEIVAPERLVEETRQRFVDADADRARRFFICGVGSIVYTLRDLLRGAGYARRAVQYEKW